MNSLKNIFLVVICLSFVLFVNCSKPTSIAEKEVNYIPYYLKVYEADSLFMMKNYERSFEILDSLFQKYEPLNQFGVYEMQTYVKTAYLTGNHKSIKPIFSKLFDTWGYETKYLKYDSIMNLAFEKSKLS